MHPILMVFIGIALAIAVIVLSAAKLSGDISEQERRRETEDQEITAIAESMESGGDI